MSSGEPARAIRCADGFKQSTKDGLAGGPFNGWSVIEAADMSAAAKLLADHPFIGRGGVMQISEPAAI